MRAIAAVLALTIAGTGLAVAQKPPIESVTVTGEKTREAVDRFVKSVATPTRTTGRVARWEVPVCPYVVGIQPAAITFITKRIKDVAAEAGARAATQAACKPNVKVIFTRTPQSLIDDIKDNAPYVLGFYDSSAERDRLAKITLPIQAWYRTGHRDVRGVLYLDKPNLELQPQLKPVKASRISDGMQTELFDVVILANPDLLKDRMVETVSDYIAMLALTQVQERDACQELPSIINVLAKDCANPPEGLTINDLGYLRGVYAAHAGMVSHLQKHEIANRMEQMLEGR